MSNSPATTTRHPTRASVPAPPTTTPAGAPPSAEPSGADAALELLKDSAAPAADLFVTLTGSGPIVDMLLREAEAARRLAKGDDLGDVAADFAVPYSLDSLLKELATLNQMAVGERVALETDFTAAFEGVGGRGSSEISITRGERGFEVELSRAGGVGGLFAEESSTGEAKGGILVAGRQNARFQVATLEEATTLARNLAIASVAPAGSAYEAWEAVRNPGLKEITLGAADQVFVELAAKTPGGELDTKGQFSIDGLGEAGVSASFEAGEPPALVLSARSAIEGGIGIASVFGNLSAGMSHGVEGSLTKELRYPLPPGATLADLPRLLADGTISASTPTVRWQAEATISQGPGKELAIEAELELTSKGFEIKEGTIEGRRVSGGQASIGAMKQSTGGEVGVGLEHSMRLRRESFSSSAELGDQLRAVRSDLVRSF